MNIKSVSLGLLLLFLIAAPPSWASYVLSPKEVVNNTAGNDSGGSYPATNMIDGSGLSVPIASNTNWADRGSWDDWQTYFAQNPTHDSAGTAAWYASENKLAGIVTLNLGANWSIDKLALWNGALGGVTHMEVWFDSDSDFTNAGHEIGVMKNPGVPTDPTGFYPVANPNSLTPGYSAEFIEFDSPYEAAFVHLNLTGTNFGWGQYLSIGEIAFSATPAPLPPAAFLLFSGLLGIASFRRFKR